ncbi:hypothetical protein COEREDRAFT_89098 [Coemansia reversa NRRL 1564]|uniref:Uncharacterized protein n=1 Tax=Coemansia reversa (strain ATCC 12441 / NRRL 1564) TaxID=763665 RepID=A0A2G5B4U6_COERN|nr:hypothetical protein COEREDRAFT_89098 [Coemansia reversa NRRL 1564]|eukprot:PIA14026.1 hypothetical protein COEREDRAFT_89098 [Coemansia reversa NRRL 1564]
MNFFFLILAFLAFSAFGFAESNDSNKSDIENFLIPAALASIGGLAACFYLTLFKPDSISLEHGSSEDDFKNAGYAISLPSPAPSASSASPPIVSLENLNLFWCGFAFFVAFVAFYCMVAFLVRKDCIRRIIAANYQPPATVDNSRTIRHLQAAVALLKKQLTMQQNQVELLCRKSSTFIDEINVLKQKKNYSYPLR